jgi:hypothetical protein
MAASTVGPSNLVNNWIPARWLDSFTRTGRIMNGFRYMQEGSQLVANVQDQLDESTRRMCDVRLERCIAIFIPLVCWCKQ